MTSRPDLTGLQLEVLLTRVFLKAADPGPAHARLRLRFLHTDPDACVLVDGRSGASVITTGLLARSGTADLTFHLRGPGAHRFWRGDLNVVAAMTDGTLRIEGALLRALALAPGLKLVQAAYRELMDELD
ncbi:hypothetical protein E7T09_11180 [Deinococcus sp. KSM4-11]|uniref:hypothetical protein n=1 Tax=Deinococcus sp. KSM4-11 TaxID=2568654 RepID=UPI0010A3D48D|nr:hypothetical protein [Deinococcus sp. KSM4-11]THF86649.1 hypothetical protein E7T09_11180 [Deinococcus sp. KSM4-11]